MGGFRGSRHAPDAVDGPSCARRGLGVPGRSRTCGTGTESAVAARTCGVEGAGTLGRGAVPPRPAARSRTTRTRAINSSVRNGLAR